MSDETSHVFLSYAREDREVAEKLAAALGDLGHDVWWDRKLIVGGNYAVQISNQLATAACVIVLWSRSSVASRWVVDEAEAGLDRDVLVPVRIEDVKPPLGYGTIQGLDLVGWQGEERADLAALLTEIDRRVADHRPPAAQTSVLLRLRYLGFYDGAVDSVPAEKTEHAIRAFQVRRGIAVDGDAGAVATEIDRAEDEVREIQRLLQARGFDPGTVDGVPDVKTVAAAKAFVRDRKMALDVADGPSLLAVAGALRDELERASASTPQRERATPPRWWTRAWSAENRRRTVALAGVAAVLVIGAPFALRSCSDDDPPIVHEREVPGAVAWTDTRIDLSPGDRVQITADGTIRHAVDDPSSETGPEGDDEVVDDRLNEPGVGVYPNAPPPFHGGLVGRINDGEVFAVGSGWDGLVEGGGRLFLGINDYNGGDVDAGVANNSGSFFVTIGITPGD